ncbi:uncharacterized protein LOC117327067 [Pecten maximus]|uniref:uncharacterized protein LOC117327067 n=1 Tax=Pecten maximus TaxID=6579 RepID=UPI001458A090|nr:uncharacterized protein LOC117327067 [Pecten maximus]
MQEKWSAQANKKSKIYSKFLANLQFEVIYQLMKQSRLFRQCYDRCVYDLCLNGVPMEFYPGELVCTKEEYDQHIFVLVLTGDIELVTDPPMDWEHILGPGRVFCRCDWMEDIGQLEAVGHCLVVKMTHNDVFQAIDSSPGSVLTYPPEPEHIP